MDFDHTDNLFIKGDNLQVLKVLQKSYYGKVKMIYIDPPYNTGSDFIYSDKFTRTKKEKLIANGSIDEYSNVIITTFTAKTLGTADVFIAIGSI